MDPTLVVRCACGWETTGTEDEVVAATGEHGTRLHNMDATREQILLMATPVVPAAPATVDIGEPTGQPDAAATSAEPDRQRT
jgi:predicted small metal-binding protein